MAEYDHNYGVETKYVECPGEAHSNPYIDHCMTCLPNWGRIAIPASCADLSAAQLFWAARNVATLRAVEESGGLSARSKLAFPGQLAHLACRGLVERPKGAKLYTITPAGREEITRRA
jgi:hypothetical protein